MFMSAYSIIGTLTRRLKMPIKKSSQKVTKTNVSDKWISGVIGGICKAYGFNPFLVRLAFLALILFTSGAFILLYIVLACLMPSEVEAQ
jgi:phage shock protein PspC (stress-responsive transcriptional regulator)